MQRLQDLEVFWSSRPVGSADLLGILRGLANRASLSCVAAMHAAAVAKAAQRAERAQPSSASLDAANSRTSFIAQTVTSCRRPQLLAEEMCVCCVHHASVREDFHI